MKIKSLWVVTKPTEHSTESDIVFHATPADLQKQFLGGLKGEEIHAFYTQEDEARTVALWLLDHRATITPWTEDK